jgi:hypothetical protein
MNDRTQTIIAAAGGAIGWLATITLTDMAGALAALATAAWFASQTWMLWKRERCNNRHCSRRRP